MHVRRGSGRSVSLSPFSLIGADASSARRGPVIAILAAATAGLIAVPAGADPAPAPSPVPPVTSAVAPVSPSAGATGERTVAYGGVSVRVPASWRVVDLDRTPGACVRLDVPTVYTGVAAEQQDCPAHVVGRDDTVWLAPAAPAATGATGATGRVGALAAHIGTNTAAHEQVSAISARPVVVQATWGASRTTIDRALASVRATPGVSTSANTGRAAAVRPGSTPSVAATEAGAAPRATPTASSAAFTGLGLDTCAAPSTTTMSAWKASPYRAVGIYIGGADRACGDGNLSASWVSSVSGSGWGIIPIYVGLQAPCAQQGGLSTISTTSASSQGTAAGADAVVKARKFGIGTGRPLYFDMESYATGNTSCRTAVLSFLSAWTNAVHRSGYLSGVYGGPGSVMSDMASAGSGFTQPDHVWFAYWNYQADNRAQSRYPRFSDTKWANHQRLHQYSGDSSETWGGRQLRIDANWVDAPLAGHAVPVSYGSGVAGPAGTGFSFTGPMTSWHAMSGQGVASHAFYTGDSGGSSEVNGATWSVPLAAGKYTVQAYLPATNSSGKARYRVSAPGITPVSTVVNQSGTKGYRTLTTITVGKAGTATVHVGDNGGSPARTPFAVDAVRFQRVSAPPPALPPPPAKPSAPRTLNATVASALSTITWSAPASGSGITGYTVTASPGGRSATVGGTARSASVGGLTNGTSYTFSVTARNAGGTGAAGRVGPVVPVQSARITTVTPARVVATAHGTTSNPGAKTLAAGETRTFRIAGVKGSPVPSGAPAAYLRMSVAASAAGYLSTTAGTMPFGVGTESSARLVPLSGGRVSVTNRSARPVQLIIDAQGYAAVSGTRWNTTALTRVVDSRTGTRSNVLRTPIPAGKSVVLRIAGVTGSPVPSRSAGALLNVAASAPGSPGYLTASSTTTSVLDFVQRRTAAATALVKLSSTGTVTITNHSRTPLHIAVDVQGYVGTAGKQWTSVRTRTLFSSDGPTATVPRPVALAKGASIRIPVRAVYGSPVPVQSSAVMLAIKTTRTSGTGWVGPAGSAVSLLGLVSGVGTHNTAVLTLDSSGAVTLTNHSAASVNLVVEVVGYAGG